MDVVDGLRSAFPDDPSSEHQANAIVKLIAIRTTHAPLLALAFPNDRP